MSCPKGQSTNGRLCSRLPSRTGYPLPRLGNLHCLSVQVPFCTALCPSRRIISRKLFSRRDSAHASAILAPRDRISSARARAASASSLASLRSASVMTRSPFEWLRIAKLGEGAAWFHPDLAAVPDPLPTSLTLPAISGLRHAIPVLALGPHLPFFPVARQFG